MEKLSTTVMGIYTRDADRLRGKGSNSNDASKGKKGIKVEQKRKSRERGGVQNRGRDG